MNEAAQVMAQLAPRGQLVFMPDVWKHLAAAGIAPGRVRRLIREAYDAGDIELRPEGGLGRLTAAEKAHCLQAEGGIILSWGRVLKRA